MRHTGMQFISHSLSNSCRPVFHRFLLFSAFLTIPLFGISTAFAAESAADRAWEAFQAENQPLAPPDEWRTSRPSREQIQSFNERQADQAGQAAELARSFYLEHPQDERAAEARLEEYNLLQTMMQLGDTSVQEQVLDREEALLASEGVSEDEKFELMMNAVQRPLMGATTETVGPALEKMDAAYRRLIERFPGRAESGSLLMQLVNLHQVYGESKDAEALLRKVLNQEQAAEELTEMAGMLVKPFDYLGKPLELEVTGLEGQQIDLQEMDGRVVLVNFWATWCGPCVAEIPELKEVYSKHHDEGFEILGVSLDYEKEPLQKMIEEKGLNWLHYFDGQEETTSLAERFGIVSTPTLWLVDKKGVLRYINARAELEEKVVALLSE